MNCLKDGVMSVIYVGYLPKMRPRFISCIAIAFIGQADITHSADIRIQHISGDIIATVNIDV